MQLFYGSLFLPLSLPPPYLVFPDNDSIVALETLVAAAVFAYKAP